MLRFRLAAAAAADQSKEQPAGSASIKSSHGNRGEFDDGFVIRGIQEPTGSLERAKSSRGSQLRGLSFTGSAAPVYKPRPRPQHLAKEAILAKAVAKGQQMAQRFRAHGHLTRWAVNGFIKAQRAARNQVVVRKWKEVGNMLKKTANGVSKLKELVEKDKKTYIAATQEAER
ncbi:hypothetical protein GPECTOR_624g718 [Gonium pectorale]|uniref:Uncharacterized protein n=1 Tax=Gonium pectorale TaxID=33097 RepID=A0A150FUH1_GONPE|nr:hypothetical protein GPECTOR_624g718 [Gonium pectorale]|eukprot:KXZ41236.1 hypothetical protein GPECTOR_624g718 [Gonium pectorale]